MTVGALQAIHDLGVRVPEDLGIVGFDDSPWAELIKPAPHRRRAAHVRDRPTAAELLTTHDDEPASSRRARAEADRPRQLRALPLRTAPCRDSSSRKPS